MMTDEGGAESSITGGELNVHIKQELDKGPCSPSPSTMQSGSQSVQSEKNFNKNCNVCYWNFQNE